MKQFYREYSRGNKAESLRRATLHVKSRYPHPGYWGAFVLTGDCFTALKDTTRAAMAYGGKIE